MKNIILILVISTMVFLSSGCTTKFVSNTPGYSRTWVHENGFVYHTQQLPDGSKCISIDNKNENKKSVWIGCSVVPDTKFKSRNYPGW